MSWCVVDGFVGGWGICKFIAILNSVEIDVEVWVKLGTQEEWWLPFTILMKLDDAD